MDTWKRWMLICQCVIENEVKNETFYFDTKEEMLAFTRRDDVRVGKMFHLEDVEFE